MDRRRLLLTSLAGALAAPLAVEAQQASRVRRIGFLRIDRPPAAWIDGFLLGLREQQYVEGKNFVIDYGLARNAAELPEIATTLVRSKVDVLVASGTPSVVPAMNATKTIPVVFVAAVDPVAAGVTASLSHPGGNVTGVTAMHADLIAKRLGLLKDVSPRVSRVTILTRATSPATAQYVNESQLAAQTLGIRLHVIRVTDPVEIEGALKAIPDGGALMVADDAVLHRLPHSDWNTGAEKAARDSVRVQRHGRRWRSDVLWTALR
jgi:putative ABC transport system substrate-binding protein